jgi:hypothetical protein
MKPWGLGLAFIALCSCTEAREEITLDGQDASPVDGAFPDSILGREPDVDASATTEDAGYVDTDAGEGGPDAHAADAGTVVCQANVRRCDGNVAAVCAPYGSDWTSLTCANTCAEGFCLPLSLETGFVVHQFDLKNDSIKTPATYSFENEGLVALQSANPMASVYYNETQLPAGVEIRGRFSVRTTSDDDIIGFVFGWQDPGHFYLFDWKQAAQNDGTCGLASEGASLKVVSTETPIEDCTDFWRSAGTDKVRPIVDVVQNPGGWKDNTDYDLVLSFRPGMISVRVFEGGEAVVVIDSNDSTYTDGKFGFFNYSQQDVRYEFFSISPI